MNLKMEGEYVVVYQHLYHLAVHGGFKSIQNFTLIFLEFFQCLK